MKRLLLTLVTLCMLSVGLFGQCDPGIGTGTSYNGEEVLIDVCPLGEINPDVTFDPEFGEITLLVAALIDENTALQGFCPLAYNIFVTGNANQTFSMTLNYEGWTNATLQTVTYYNGVYMTVPDNIVWGYNQVSFDITNPGPGICFYLKNLPQTIQKGKKHRR